MHTASDTRKGVYSVLRELLSRNPATGLLTSDRIFRVLLAEIARGERYGNPLSCILLRLPGLSTAADELRLQVASRVADVMRNTDHAAVWGEEAFLLVLPETGEAGAQQFTTKLKQALGNLDIDSDLAGNDELTARTTIATRRAGDDADAILDRLGTSARF